MRIVDKHVSITDYAPAPTFAMSYLAALLTKNTGTPVFSYCTKRGDLP